MKLSSQVHAYAEQVLAGDYLLATYYTEAPVAEDIYLRADFAGDWPDDRHVDPGTGNHGSHAGKSHGEGHLRVRCSAD